MLKKIDQGELLLETNLKETIVGFDDFDIRQSTLHFSVDHRTADFDLFEDASNVSSFAQDALRWAVGNNIITGKERGTMLDPQGNASRAECATIINRFMNVYI